MKEVSNRPANLGEEFCIFSKRSDLRCSHSGRKSRQKNPIDLQWSNDHEFESQLSLSHTHTLSGFCHFLTHTLTQVFERLLKKHICSSIPATLDPLQFAYRPNRSTDDAISQVLHSSLTHIDSKNGNYVRLLFIDYSSAFNTIVPSKLAVKLSDLGL